MRLLKKKEKVSDLIRVDNRVETGGNSSLAHGWRKEQ